MMLLTLSLGSHERHSQGRQADAFPPSRVACSAVGGEHSEAEEGEHGEAEGGDEQQDSFHGQFLPLGCGLRRVVVGHGEPAA
jgi:hypothetical protein